MSLLCLKTVVSKYDESSAKDAMPSKQPTVALDSTRESPDNQRLCEVFHNVHGDLPGDLDVGNDKPARHFSSVDDTLALNTSLSLYD